MYYIYLLAACIITVATTDCAQKVNAVTHTTKVLGHANLMRMCFEAQIESNMFKKISCRLNKEKKFIVRQIVIEHLIDSACRQPLDCISVTNTYNDLFHRQKSLADFYLKLIDHKITFDLLRGQDIIYPCITLKLDKDVQEAALKEREKLREHYLWPHYSH